MNENQMLSTKINDLTLTLKEVRDDLGFISDEFLRNTRMKNELLQESHKRQHEIKNESQNDTCANTNVPDAIIRLQKQNQQISP